ncbi:MULTISPECIES: hypothetical protein [Cylindrospermopsis]|jgi:hypothetical protein|uniref:hypothetical protein n=1 Tax=Cylindrospermopsis TaxID=77021 RepID=UPI000AE2F749|nr:MULTISPECIES: hypothetical protein [Cylindrospermopsis]MBU6346789.1 hypothetical protein [Cyanobacteria bacterium REEB494]UJS04711.1 hypothetical protein L3I90_00070 [Cylindrospermopsis raciborskii KLL07]
MIKIKTKKTVINEEIPNFDGDGGEKQRNFADLRKVGLDTSQGKGLKWRGFDLRKKE